jgi:hypothetical protein
VLNTEPVSRVRGGFTNAVVGRRPCAYNQELETYELADAMRHNRMTFSKSQARCVASRRAGRLVRMGVRNRACVLTGSLALGFISRAEHASEAGDEWWERETLGKTDLALEGGKPMVDINVLSKVVSSMVSPYCMQKLRIGR